MPNIASLIQVKAKRKMAWRNIRIIRMPYDGTPNPKNPYDKLSSEEREKKIIAICRKIWLRMIEEDRKIKNS